MKKYLTALCFILSFIMAAGCTVNRPAETEEETTVTEAAETEKETVTEKETETGAETEPGPEPEKELFWEGAHVKSLKIAGTDISSYKVVCQTDNSDLTVKLAATDLTSYIEKATGFKPQKSDGAEKADHEICVGATDRDTDRVKAEREKLVNHGYAIIYDGGRLYITGKTATGTMYGVYSFLEDFVGCRFYAPKFEDIKFAEEINVPEDTCVTFSPKLIYRDPYDQSAFDPAFSVKLKINGAVNRTFKNRGEGVSYAGPFVHSLPSLAGTGTAPNVQPCLTDPAVYEKVLKNVRNYLKQNPGAKIVSVSQNDSYADGLGCQCENCKKLDDEQGTPMGSLLTFVNRIANDIKDEYPDVYVDTLAYRYTRKPPKTLKPADNVIIRLCSIECCYSHPLDDPDCAANAQFKADIEAWSSICKNLFVWDYVTNFMYYVNPFPNINILYDNVKFYAEHNVIGLFEEGNYQSVSGEFGELRSYLLAKLLWDPDMPRERYDEYMNDFLKGYYGAGWKYIREYIDRTSAKAAEGHVGIYDPVNKVFTFTGTKRKADLVAFIAEMKELWDKAYEEADDLHKPNVEKSSLQVISAGLYAKWTKKESPDILKNFHELLKKHGVTYFREGAKVPETVDYTKGTW